MMAGGSAPAGTATKSILKGADSAEAHQSRRKKRNKSVGFILAEGESSSKKTKTEDISASKKHESRVFRNSRLKKHKKNRISKDHPVNKDMEDSPGPSSAPVVPKKLKRKVEKTKTNAQDKETETNNDDRAQSKPDIVSGTDDSNNNVTQKLKKRKRQRKSAKAETEEPTRKVCKDPTSEDELTEELENMHIGPNQSNLTDLLDAMVPAAPQAAKPKRERNSFPKPEVGTSTDANGNEFNLKKIVKWTKKQWNKDRKDAASESSLTSQVVVDNLPVIMTSVYRKKLMEVFEQYGPINRIGAAEVHPSDNAEAIFSTTIYFENEEAAIKALEEDNTRFGGSLIRVRRPPPPAETWARSYTDLSAHMQELKVFHSAGTDRRALAPQLRGSGSAFVEYDGAEAVQRALALSEALRSINTKPGKKRNSHQNRRTPLKHYSSIFR